MSRDIYFSIEYLNYDKETSQLEFKLLKEDISGIIPLIIRDYADDLFKSHFVIPPGSWFKDKIDNYFYFMRSDIPDISEKLKKLALTAMEDEDDSLYSEFVAASEWIKGFNVLIDYFLDENNIYSHNSDTIRIIGGIE